MSANNAVAENRFSNKLEHVVNAVWLKRNGNRVEVSVEIHGKWYLVITEVHDSNFSHIMELANHTMAALKPDPIAAE